MDKFIKYTPNAVFRPRIKTNKVTTFNIKTANIVNPYNTPRLIIDAISKGWSQLCSFGL